MLIPVVRELTDGKAWDPARRPDHRDAARRLRVDRPLGWCLAGGRAVRDVLGRPALLDRASGSTHSVMLAAPSARPLASWTSTPGCSSVSATPVSVRSDRNRGRSAR